MAIEKKLICFARLAEFERQLAAGNILDYSIVFIQDAKMIWNRGTYYDCNGSSDAAVYGDGYINSEVRDDGTHLKTNVADNLGAVSARGQLADALDVKTFVENAVQGGGGITVETDPVFSASPAASITEAKKTEWDNKVDKVSGKQLSTNDFTNEYRSKLDGIDEHVQSDWAQGDVANASYIKNRTHYASVISYVGEFVTVSKEVGDVLCEGLSIGGIYTIINQTNTVNRTMFQFVVGRKINIPFNGPTVEALCSENGSLVLASSTGGIVQSFSVHYTEAKPLDDVYIPETIARKAEIATINGQSLTEGGDITIEGGSLTESDIAAMGFTKNTGTYSKPSTGIPKSDLASAVQTSLGKADTALQSYTEQYKGTVTGVKINGTTKSPSSGVVDLGTVITDVSNLATKDEVILKDVTGELVTVQTQALYGGGSVYALPDTANGDEDDILLSSGSVKTINGESILGSGNISISGGSGGEDIRYFTEFTVEDFIEGCQNCDIISEDSTELVEAARNNKIICVPFRSANKGYNIAYYNLFDESGDTSINLYIEKDGVQYVALQYSGYLEGMGFKIFTPQYILDEPNESEVYLTVKENTIYELSGWLNYLYCFVDHDCKTSSTIRFVPSDDFTLEMNDVYWANGVIPQFEEGVLYELSLSTGHHGVAAVLTPFKSVE